MQDDAIESINFQPSMALERFLVAAGRNLYEAVIAADRIDELAALLELTSTYSGIASAYGEKTSRVPEDLGVGLNEAVLLKHSDITQHGAITNTEWRHHADDTLDALSEIDTQQ